MLKNKAKDGNSSDEEGCRDDCEDGMFKLQSEVELASELGAESLVARKIQPGRHGVGRVADSNKDDSGRC